MSITGAIIEEQKRQKREEIRKLYFEKSTFHVRLQFKQKFSRSANGRFIGIASLIQNKSLEQLEEMHQWFYTTVIFPNQTEQERVISIMKQEIGL
jgi:hypothetical protein